MSNILEQLNNLGITAKYICSDYVQFTKPEMAIQHEVNIKKNSDKIITAYLLGINYTLFFVTDVSDLEYFKKKLNLGFSYQTLEKIAVDNNYHVWCILNQDSGNIHTWVDFLQNAKNSLLRLEEKIVEKSTNIKKIDEEYNNDNVNK